jgi:hypothetical protein
MLLASSVGYEISMRRMSCGPALSYRQTDDVRSEASKSSYGCRQANGPTERRCLQTDQTIRSC